METRERYFSISFRTPRHVLSILALYTIVKQEILKTEVLRAYEWNAQPSFPRNIPIIPSDEAILHRNFSKASSNRDRVACIHFRGSSSVGLFFFRTIISRRGMLLKINGTRYSRRGDGLDTMGILINRLFSFFFFFEENKSVFPLQTRLLQRCIFIQTWNLICRTLRFLFW